MITPRWMKLSIGLISVCGQFASRPACSFSAPAIAVRSSHSARRCGSSASDFTVRMPCTVSTIVEPLLALGHGQLADDPAQRRQEQQDDRR